MRKGSNRQDCSSGGTKLTASLRLPTKLSTFKKKWFYVDTTSIVYVKLE